MNGRHDGSRRVVDAQPGAAEGAPELLFTDNDTNRHRGNDKTAGANRDAVRTRERPVAPRLTAAETEAHRAFIATLGTLSIFTAIALLYSGGSSIQADRLPDTLNFLGQGFGIGQFRITWGIVVVILLVATGLVVRTQHRLLTRQLDYQPDAVAGLEDVILRLKLPRHRVRAAGLDRSCDVGRRAPALARWRR